MEACRTAPALRPLPRSRSSWGASFSAQATSAGQDICSCDLEAKPESLAASRKDGRLAKEIQYMLLGENGCTYLADNLRNYNSHGDALQQLRLLLSAEEEQG